MLLFCIDMFQLSFINKAFRQKSIKFKQNCDAFSRNEAYVADSNVEQQAFICVKGWSGDFELIMICKVYLLPYNLHFLSILCVFVHEKIRFLMNTQFVFEHKWPKLVTFSYKFIQ